MQGDSGLTKCELSPEQETEIPMDAHIVCTYLLPPPTPLNGFPVVNEDFINHRQVKKAEKWLKHGRAALLDGVMRGRIPRDPCYTRWPSGCLGGQYAREIHKAEGKKEFWVRADFPTASVEWVTDMSIDENSDGDDEVERVTPRYATPDFRDELFQPLHQSREGAKSWDTSMKTLTADQQNLVANPSSAVSIRCEEAASGILPGKRTLG